MQVQHLQFRANGRNRITVRLGAPLMFGFGADGQGMLPWLAQNLSALLTILVSILLLAALAVLLFGVVREIRRNAVFLDPIDVPRALDTRGYSPAVVAERLLDALSAMQRKAPTLKELLGVSDIFLLAFYIPLDCDGSVHYIAGPGERRCHCFFSLSR